MKEKVECEVKLKFELGDICRYQIKINILINDLSIFSIFKKRL